MAGIEIYVVPNPDPDKHYYWASMDERLSETLANGYALVKGATVEDTKKEAERLGFPVTRVDLARNIITAGQNCLVAIANERFLEMRRAKKQERNELLGRTEDAYMAAIDSMPGATPFKKELGEIEDRKKSIATTDSRTFVASKETRATGRSKPGQNRR